MSPTLLLLLAWIVLLPYMVWVLFLAIMSLYRAHLAGRLPRQTKPFAYPLVVVGFVADWALNWTWASVVFDELPKSRKELVTDRLKRYMAAGSFDAVNQTYRYRRAKLFCKTFLDLFDPSPKGHCS